MPDPPQSSLGHVAGVDASPKFAALAAYLPERHLKLYSEPKQKAHAVLMAEVFPIEYDFYL